MTNFAVIKTGGKQYIVKAGQKLKIEKISAEESGNFEFDKVLLVADESGIKLGKPFVVGAKVGAKVLRQARDRKKIIFRYHSKTRYRKMKGHRQPFTEVEIMSF